mmetsp:Transcript_19222/g.30025  ORF Transcript_19222/g.30025 Transcript_19222/m.30025 type:complete len:103 (+) Transcript_19222:2015-2323(+)
MRQLLCVPLLLSSCGICVQVFRSTSFGGKAGFTMTEDDYYDFYDGRTDFYGFYDGRTDYYDRRMDSASLHVLRQPLCAPLMLFACGTSVYRSARFATGKNGL